MKTLLVTGGSGFIGSNFIKYVLEKQTEFEIVNLDLLSYAGKTDNTKDLDHYPHYHFVQGDIRDSVLLKKLFREYNFEGVVHFAAESHVDNSISGPEPFVTTNVLGTFHLLQSTYHYWMQGPNRKRKGFEQARFHHISTDEVFGSLGKEGYFTETSPYAPNSPYSATKAGSDFLVRSYFHTFGLNTITTNCSNNYGPRQHEEKFIPTIIRNALAGKPIPIYGNGSNIRDWLYVEDHCLGIWLAFTKGAAGETYNIGGGNERTNLEIVKIICELLDKLHPNTKLGSYSKLITFVTDRPGHDYRYAIDATKIKTELGWKAQENFESGIEKTIRWYLAN